MDLPEDQERAKRPEGEVSPSEASPDPGPLPASGGPSGPSDLPSEEDQGGSSRVDSHVDSHHYYDDPYLEGSYEGGHSAGTASATAVAPAPPVHSGPPAGGGPPGGDGGDDGHGEDEEGMVRMSFLEHLEELRRRLFYAVGGLVLGFGLSLTFANYLWNIVAGPAVRALEQLGVNPPELAQIAPLEYFNIVWFKLPLLASIFIASPILLYQVWAFIAPGLYKRERRWAAPFVISTAGLFILGGLFGYFVVFRFALVFLLGLGIGNHVHPVVSVTEYFDIFCNVMLGIGVVFELPVLIFFLTLIRVLSPSFLMNHVRYAILGIFILAAIITPTPDIFNMVLFATPMCLLFFVGIGASYILVLRREHRKFPWGTVLFYVAGFLALVAGMMYYLHARSGYHFVRHFPWFMR